MRSPAWDFKPRQQFHLLSENYIQQNTIQHVFACALFSSGTTWKLRNPQGPAEAAGFLHRSGCAHSPARTVAAPPVAFASCRAVAPRWVRTPSGRLCRAGRGEARGSGGRDPPRGGTAYPCCSRRATRWPRPAGWPGSPPSPRRCPPPAGISAGNRRLSSGFPPGSSSPALPPASPTDQLPRPIPGPGGAGAARQTAGRAGSGMPRAGGGEAAGGGGAVPSRQRGQRPPRHPPPRPERGGSRGTPPAGNGGGSGEGRRVVSRQNGDDRSALPGEAKEQQGGREVSVPLLHLPPLSQPAAAAL